MPNRKGRKDRNLIADRAIRNIAIDNKQTNEMNNFDISVHKFDEFANEYANRFMSVNSYKEILDLFCNLSNSSCPRILELACGPGNITKYLRLKFPKSEITAVDLAPRMIEIAKQTVENVDFRVMDVRDISTLNGNFDMVMCSFCFPFLSLSDATKLVADCAEKLNNGGLIYISTMEGTQEEAGFEATSFSGNSEVYFNYFEQHQLEEMLTASRFHIESIKRQEYTEADGTSSTDMIFVASKK
jgi:trans-aconitate methyltransferase